MERKTPTQEACGIMKEEAMAWRPVITIVGPTAIGKSRVGLLVAKALRTEIVSADSTQVYRGMDIGTDKPTLQEQAEIRHCLIDVVDPDQPFNAGEFRRLAQVEIERLHQACRLPLVVGGTGLYIRALLRGLWPGPPVDWDIRRQLESEADEKGVDHLYRELVTVDPETTRHLHPHDRVKVLRALEVFRQIGTPLSEAHRRHRFQEKPYRALIIGLNIDRTALYRRVEQRVEVELAKGLLQETRQLLDRGYHRGLLSMKSLGYRQMASYLEGECDFKEAVRLLQRDTRHFAKRQMTWFKKESDIVWLEVKDEETSESVADRVLHLVRQFVAGLKAERVEGPRPTMESYFEGLVNHA